MEARRVILFVVVMVLSTAMMRAYDGSVVVSTGQTLYYEIVREGVCIVAPNGTNTIL